MLYIWIITPYWCSICWLHPRSHSVTAQLNTSDSIELLLPASEGTATATRPAEAERCVRQGNLGRNKVRQDNIKHSVSPPSPPPSQPPQDLRPFPGACLLFGFKYYSTRIQISILFTYQWRVKVCGPVIFNESRPYNDSKVTHASIQKNKIRTGKIAFYWVLRIAKIVDGFKHMSIYINIENI